MRKELMALFASAFLVSNAVGACLPGQTCSEVPATSSSSSSSVSSGGECRSALAQDYFDTTCLPGACGELFFSKATVDEIVARIKEEEREKFGSAQDYFDGEKEYFDRAAVEEILNRCKADPKACGIDAVPVTKIATPREEVVHALANKKVHITGYYLNYGGGAFDWIYVSPYKNVYKLEKGIGEDYVLQWTTIQRGSDKAFSNITIGDGYIEFGESLLP